MVFIGANSTNDTFGIGRSGLTTYLIGRKIIIEAKNLTIRPYR